MLRGALGTINPPSVSVNGAGEKESGRDIYAVPKRGRSLRMQVRFMRTLIFAARLFSSVLFWYYLMPKVIGQERVDRGSMARTVRYARRFRGFAVVMGGVMIKLGQFISTRVDALPEAITNELAGLQDEVPPVPEGKIRAAIERELGSIPARYQWFADEPVAAASLGQVYRARLLNGDREVVKVQRPGIRNIVYTDLAALKIVARVAKQFKFIRRRADTAALADEFGRVLLEEVSYTQEAKNAARFTEMFKDDMGIYIPDIYPEHSTDSILTIEDVTSIKISDYAALEAAGIDRREVAKRLMDCYLKQIFEERFFHADPHPGNLFVYPLPNQNGAKPGKGGRDFYLIFIDFGMTGSLTPQLGSGLVNTLAAVITRDADKLVDSYGDLGFLLPGADTDRVKEATRAVFDQFWGMSMTQIKDVSYSEAANLGQEFNDLLYAMPFQVPQDFIYLGRAVGILSGMATSLDPHFNPWQELQPYVQKLVTGGFLGGNGTAGSLVTGSLAESLFNGNGAGALLELGRSFLGRTAALPAQVESVLGQLDRGDLSVKVTPTATYRQQFGRLEAQQRRTTRAVMFAGLLISSTMLYTAGEATPALIGYVLSGLTLLSVWLTGNGE